MILLFLIIIVLAIIAFFDVSFDFQKDYGVIWYSFKDRRAGFVLWGSKY